MTMEAQSISPDELIDLVHYLKEEGYRFVTMTCVSADNRQAELLYHFDQAFRLHHLRLPVAADKLVPSICTIYRAAFLVENEIQDQFGISFGGLEPDYRRTLMLEGDRIPPPFRCQVPPAKE